MRLMQAILIEKISVKKLYAKGIVVSGDNAVISFTLLPDAAAL